MSKVLDPKKLAITTIITTTISLILSVILNIINIPLYLRLSQAIGTIVNFIIYGNLYIIIYLLIILIKKQKNIKRLNTILLISLIVAIIYQVFYEVYYMKNTYGFLSAKISNYDNFMLFFNFISSLLFLTLEIIMVYGILTKKKLPYRIFTIILITLSLIGFISSTYSIFSYSSLLLSSLNLLSAIIGTIKSCSFVLFIYLYGKSIIERSKNNE